MSTAATVIFLNPRDRVKIKHTRYTHGLWIIEMICKGPKLLVLKHLSPPLVFLWGHSLDIIVRLTSVDEGISPTFCCLVDDTANWVELNFHLSGVATLELDPCSNKTDVDGNQPNIT